MQWKWQLNIKQFLQGEAFDRLLDCDPVPPEVVENVIKELTRIPAVENFTRGIVKRLHRVKTVKGFNSVLESLYDLGDDKGIWLGL